MENRTIESRYCGRCQVATDHVVTVIVNFGGESIERDEQCRVCGD